MVIHLTKQEFINEALQQVEKASDKRFNWFSNK